MTKDQKIFISKQIGGWNNGCWTIYIKVHFYRNWSNVR
jgi:hypothetical protein